MMSGLEAGKLRHRIKLERQIETQDMTTGEIVTSWQTIGEVWADINPLSAREYIQAQAWQGELTAKVVIRYRPDIKAGDRFSFRGNNYYIKAALPDNDSGLQHITLMCSQGVRAE